ncbi:hypothetical protein [Bradyrhizobium japonicum]|uniref:hypothetical protein n=1 Tax=Bradyrhizobium japonicum TaxID=375 RepID=UPI000421638D|nr:hypothetical protein [Bradyrhizobium japonicum]WLB87703.1 hypothetical protein QIH91_34070 [Bradyrhizobium japonicum USDA 135]
MLLLLPISRFRVEYRVAQGRPYSVFERLILQAIHRGTSDVAMLREIFQVHPRLILEALVTLTQAGWLAVGGLELQGFRLTSAGEAAALSGEVPRARSSVSTHTSIVMERLTGALINEGMVRHLQNSQVAALMENAIKVREYVHSRRISEGQIDSLLPRAKNEWLHRVDSIDLKSRQAHWLPITLDVATGQFDDNLPFSWRNRVGPALSEEAQKSPRFKDAHIRAYVGPDLPARDKIGRDEDVQRVGNESSPVRIQEADLISTDGEHLTYLVSALRETRSKIFIASAFLRANCLEALRAEMMSALARGVAVDVLWGYNSGRLAEVDGIEVLKKISFEARHNKFKGKLSYNLTASGSHAKIIIWDQAPQVFEACIGSFNWLSVKPNITKSSEETESTNLSIRIRSSLLISRLLRSVASLWAGGSISRLDAAPDRWRRVASDLERTEVQVESDDDKDERSNAVARLVLDFDHDALLRTGLTTAQNQLIVVSHKLGVAARTRLVTATSKLRSTDFRFSVFYGQRDVEEAAYAEIEDLVGRAGGKICRKPGLHAKVLVADNWVCLGSYNFLSTDVYGTSSRTKELSVILEGLEVVNWIRGRLPEEPD